MLFKVNVFYANSSTRTVPATDWQTHFRLQQNFHKKQVLDIIYQVKWFFLDKSINKEHHSCLYWLRHFDFSALLHGFKWNYLTGRQDLVLALPFYDKCDDFNFPFPSSGIPSSFAYGVFISQLIRYARDCSSYKCFNPRTMRLWNKLLGKRYVGERLKPSFGKLYGW